MVTLARVTVPRPPPYSLLSVFLCISFPGSLSGWLCFLLFLPFLFPLFSVALSLSAFSSDSASLSASLFVPSSFSFSLSQSVFTLSSLDLCVPVIRRFPLHLSLSLLLAPAPDVTSPRPYL